jgi:ABC-type tungstate transport system substrate-binding protein
MGKLSQDTVQVNWILVLIVGWFGPIGGFIACHILMKNPARALGQAIYMFVPLLNLIVWIDMALVAKKLQEEGSVDEFEHFEALNFLSGLPLMHE